MPYHLIFLCISFSILFFSFITIFTAPIINKVIKDSPKWGTLNCKKYSDLYELYDMNEDLDIIFENITKKEKYMNNLKEGNKLCKKKISMYNFEYVSLITDIIIGLICTIISIKYFFIIECDDDDNEKKNENKNEDNNEDKNGDNRSVQMNNDKNNRMKNGGANEIKNEDSYNGNIMNNNENNKLINNNINNNGKKENNFYKKIIGPTGISSGVIGFIFTLVYIIYSEDIFNNGSPGKEYENPEDPKTFSVYNSNKIYRLNEERAFATWNKEKKRYDCMYYNENDEDSFYIKYKELGQQQYNYNKTLYIFSTLNNSKLKNCNCNSPTWNPDIECEFHTINNKFLRPQYGTDEYLCPNLVYNSDEINKETINRHIYDRWVTTIVFCYFIIILNISLCIFGLFLLIENNIKKI